MQLRFVVVRCWEGGGGEAGIQLADGSCSEAAKGKSKGVWLCKDEKHPPGMCWLFSTDILRGIF